MLKLTVHVKEPIYSYKEKVPELCHSAHKDEVTNKAVTAYVSLDKGFMNLCIKSPGVGRCADNKEVKLVGLDSKAKHDKAGD